LQTTAADNEVAVNVKVPTPTRRAFAKAFMIASISSDT
jgi:hypothetical protein